MNEARGTLGRTERVKSRREIRRLFRQGRRASDGVLRLIASPNDLGRRRVAVIVSRRHGGAVQRNRVKRLCREAYRAARENLPDGHDFVLQPRPEVSHSFAALCESIRRLGGRLTRRKDAP